MEGLLDHPISCSQSKDPRCLGALEEGDLRMFEAIIIFQKTYRYLTHSKATQLRRNADSLLLRLEI